MRVSTHINGLFEHYFTTKSTLLSGYSLFDKSLWPLGIGFVLAFFSLGVSSITVFDTSLPALFFVLAFVGFGATVVGHFLLVVFGSFYKRGVFKTIGWAIFGVLALIAGGLALGFTLYGGIFISAFLFLFVLPVETILLPFNIIGFIGGSIWWYAKGIEIVDGSETPRSAIQPEIKFFKRLFNIESA